MMHRTLIQGSWTWLAVWALCGSSASAQTFPSDAEWIVLTRDGAPITDPQNDAQGERDIVGDADNPSAFIYGDADFIYFRLRVDADPLTAGGDYRPFGWGVEIDTDGDLAAYELLSMVDGISNPDQVVLQQNTMTDVGMSARDVAETLLASYDVATHARAMAAPSMFGGDEDFFVDWAIDRDDLADAGIDLSKPLRFGFGTSNNAHTLASDLLATTTGATLEDIITDPVNCSGTSCTECAELCGDACLRCEGETPACDGASCVECASSTDCPSEEPVCDRSTGTCMPGSGCSSDDDCDDPTPACQSDGSCGQCSATNDDACGGTTPVCDVETGRCTACEGDGDCSDPAEPACQSDGSCAECSATNDARCTGDSPRCDTSRGECSPACSADDDCDDPELPACSADGTCVECSESNDSRCAVDLEACNVALGECAEVCDDDAQCADVRPICADGGFCVQCTDAAADACPDDEPICDDDTGACERAACIDDDDCVNPALPACQSDGSCSQCSATETSRCIGELTECDTDVGLCVEGAGGPDGGMPDGGVLPDGGIAGGGAGSGGGEPDGGGGVAGAPSGRPVHYEGGGIGCAAAPHRKAHGSGVVLLLMFGMVWLRARGRRASQRTRTINFH